MNQISGYHIHSLADHTLPTEATEGKTDIQEQNDIQKEEELVENDLETELEPIEENGSIDLQETVEEEKCEEEIMEIQVPDNSLAEESMLENTEGYLPEEEGAGIAEIEQKIAKESVDIESFLEAEENAGQYSPEIDFTTTDVLEEYSDDENPFNLRREC